MISNYIHFYININLTFDIHFFYIDIHIFILTVIIEYQYKIIVIIESSHLYLSLHQLSVNIILSKTKITSSLKILFYLYKKIILSL
jgi:hypothetical protein